MTIHILPLMFALASFVYMSWLAHNIVEDPEDFVWLAIGSVFVAVFVYSVVWGFVTADYNAVWAHLSTAFDNIKFVWP